MEIKVLTPDLLLSFYNFQFFSSSVHSFKEAFLFLKVKGRWERRDRYDNECKTLIPALALYFWFQNVTLPYNELLIRIAARVLGII